MEKIEVELTPVRIVEQPTSVMVQRSQNEVGVTVLKFKIVIPKIEQLEDGVEHIIPKLVDVKIPDEYIGYYLFPPLSGNVLSDTYSVRLDMRGDELKQHLLEQDYEQDFILAVLPKLDDIATISSTHIIQTQNKYGVAEFSNVPQLYLDQHGGLTTQIGKENDDDRVSLALERISIHYKGEQFNTFIGTKAELGYKVGFEVEYNDGSVVESQVGNRLGYWEVREFFVDDKASTRSIRVLFKHDDRKFTAELWNSTMQS